jgi:hypothetical protein
MLRRDFHASLSVALPRAAVMMGSRNTAIRAITSLSCVGAELIPLFRRKPCHCNCNCFERIAANAGVIASGRDPGISVRRR